MHDKSLANLPMPLAATEAVLKNGGSTVVAFEYDGQGWRTQEIASGTTDLYYTAGWQIAEERVGVSYNNARTVSVENVWSHANDPNDGMKAGIISNGFWESYDS